MPGTFSKANRPRRAGVYVNFEVAQPTNVLPAQGSVVAVPFVHTWGPINQARLVSNYDEARTLYGDYVSPGRLALKGAFRGEGLAGAGGAGAVIAYRMASSAAAKATRTVNNTAGSPVASLKVDALYQGTKGNDLRVTVQDNAADATKDELVILDGTTELERYVFAQADLASLAATVNATSQWVRVTVLVDGTALASTAAAALTGGNDGITGLAGSDWTTLMSALAVERFSVLAPYDLTDSVITASLVSWAKAQNLAGRRFMTVLGGAIGEDTTAAIARAALINDPDFVVIGVGGVTDDTDGNLSTSQLVPRIGGILAARGEGASLTFARLAGVTAIVTGASQADIDRAYNGGVVCLSRDTYTAAPVRVEKALTAYTASTAIKPRSVFGNPKFVRTMHGVQNEAGELGERPGIIGRLPVDDKTRNAIRGDVSALLQGRQDQRVIQAEWTCDVDTNPAPTDDDEFVALRLGLKFSRTTEQIFLSIVAG